MPGMAMSGPHAPGAGCRPRGAPAYSLREFGECLALVRGDVVGLVALDLVLRIVLAGAVRVALVVEVAGMDPDDGAGDAARFGVPADVVADLEARRDRKSTRLN